MIYYVILNIYYYTAQPQLLLQPSFGQANAPIWGHHLRIVWFQYASLREWYSMLFYFIDIASMIPSRVDSPVGASVLP